VFPNVPLAFSRLPDQATESEESIYFAGTSLKPSDGLEPSTPSLPSSDETDRAGKAGQRGHESRAGKESPEGE